MTRVMTAAGELRQAAHAAKRSDTLEAVTRIGFIGFGVTHLLLAWIVVQIAFGRAPVEGDQVGAFHLLREGALGTLVLAVVAIGLLGAAIWQALEAAVGHTDVHDGRRVAERLASAGRALAYGFFGFTAAKLVLSPTAGGGASEKQEAAGSLLTLPAGRFLLGAIGVGVIVLGAGLAWYGLTRHFERHLHNGHPSHATRSLLRVLGTVGYLAKAVAYGVAGVLVVTAAVQYDPQASRGIDAALRTLAQQPYGTVLLGTVALGFVAYGLFAIAQARYRDV